MSKRGTTVFSIDDLRAVLEHAAEVVRDVSLRPPAHAALLNKALLPPAGGSAGEATCGLSAAELDGLRTLALDLIGKYVAGDHTGNQPSGPGHGARHSAALQYAEAVLRQEEVLEALGRVDSSNAPLQNGLTGADRKRIDDFLLFRNTKGRFETLDSLTDLWERSVTWVEDKGESYLHDEFVDRLISRDSLEDALSLLAPTGRETLDSRVRRFDERFVRATNAVSTSIRPRSPWRPQRWWWFRVPPLMGESFQSRLEHVAPAAAQEALAAQKGAPNQPGRETPS